jgi:hypothetical protein
VKGITADFGEGFTPNSKFKFILSYEIYIFIVNIKERLRFISAKVGKQLKPSPNSSLAMTALFFLAPIFLCGAQMVEAVCSNLQANIT